MTNLFYQTPQMNVDYCRYPDVVFLNKRLSKTRFRRNILLFCGINSEGKTVVFGAAFLKEETQFTYAFAIKSFLSSVKDPPSCFMIERCSQIKAAFKHDFPGLHLLFCNYNLHKTLKH